MSIQNTDSYPFQTTLRVGGRVSFIMGRSRMTGRIIEDRGAIATGGQRLFRVEVPSAPINGVFEEALVIELPADELQEV